MEQGGKHSRGEQVALAGLTNLNLTSWSSTNLLTNPNQPNPTNLNQLTDQPTKLLARPVSTLTIKPAKKGNIY